MTRPARHRVRVFLLAAWAAWAARAPAHLAAQAPDCGPPLPPFVKSWGTQLTQLPPESYGVALSWPGIDVLGEKQADIWAGHEQVQTLFLDGNALTALVTALEAEAFVGLPRLQILISERNALPTLPSALFRALPCLRQLYLFDGQLTALDPALFARLPQLESLGLTGNRLTALDPALFARLPQLESLGLAGNRLTALDPALFARLPQLESLDLSDNRLTALDPALFARLPQLESLGLSDNRLTALDPALFARLPQLKYLGLARNRLTALDPALFARLPQLESLGLSHNRLTALDPALFRGPSRLVRLELAGNQLACLPPALFAGLDRLCTLHLNGNRLGIVAPVFFQGLTRLQTLILGPLYMMPDWRSPADRAYGAGAPCLHNLYRPPDIPLSYPACGPPAAPRAPRAVRFGPGADSPQVGRPLVAQTVPADFPGAAWRWESCADAHGRACRDRTPWHCHDPAGPVQVYVPSDADAGRYLRAFLPFLAPDGVWTRLRTPFAGPVAPASDDDVVPDAFHPDAREHARLHARLCGVGP